MSYTTERYNLGGLSRTDINSSRLEYGDIDRTGQPLERLLLSKDRYIPVHLHLLPGIF